MAKIAIYEGFGARRRKHKKSRGGHKRRARKAARRSHTDKAHTPQALRFKRAATTCRKSGNATLKEYYACMKRELRK